MGHVSMCFSTRSCRDAGGLVVSEWVRADGWPFEHVRSEQLGWWEDYSLWREEQFVGVNVLVRVAIEDRALSPDLRP